MVKNITKRDSCSLENILNSIDYGDILRMLEDKANTNKAEHDKLSNDMIQLSGKVEDIRKDLDTVEVVTARNMENMGILI